MAIRTAVASEFVSESLQPDTEHFETRWQVASASSFAAGTILEDTWYTDDDLTGYSFDVEGDAWVRVQYRDDWGVIGEWSSALAFGAPACPYSVAFWGGWLPESAL